MRRVLSVLLIMFSLLLSAAQNLNFKKYSDDEVLPPTTVYAAFLDSRGFVWFGSDFDVFNFENKKEK